MLHGKNEITRANNAYNTLLVCAFVKISNFIKNKSTARDVAVCGLANALHWRATLVSHQNRSDAQPQHRNASYTRPL